VIVLDHNIPRDQVVRLRRWRIRAEQIGFDVGRPEWQDQHEVLHHLQQRKRPTFFTRDLGFYHARMRHDRRCIVVLAGAALDTATDIRRFLRHPRFRTHAQRLGVVAKTKTATQVTYSSRDSRRPTRLRWS
jgi:hypothetical protein